MQTDTSHNYKVVRQFAINDHEGAAVTERSVFIVR